MKNLIPEIDKSSTTLKRHLYLIITRSLTPTMADFIFPYLFFRITISYIFNIFNLKKRGVREKLTSWILIFGLSKLFLSTKGYPVKCTSWFLAYNFALWLGRNTFLVSFERKQSSTLVLSNFQIIWKVLSTWTRPESKES